MGSGQTWPTRDLVVVPRLVYSKSDTDQRCQEELHGRGLGRGLYTVSAHTTSVSARVAYIRTQAVAGTPSLWLPHTGFRSGSCTHAPRSSSTSHGTPPALLATPSRPGILHQAHLNTAAVLQTAPTLPRLSISMKGRTCRASAVAASSPRSLTQATGAPSMVGFCQQPTRGCDGLHSVRVTFPARVSLLPTVACHYNAKRLCLGTDEL